MLQHVPNWVFFLAGLVFFALLQLLYMLWEQRCPRCKSWATRKLNDTQMRCSNCGEEFDF